MAALKLDNIPDQIAHQICTKFTLHECIQGGWIMTVRDRNKDRKTSWARGWAREPVAKVVVGHFEDIHHVHEFVEAVKFLLKDVRQDG